MRAAAKRPQSEMAIVASLFRDAVQVTPAADDEDALPAVSMVALPDELLQHIFRQACNALEPRRAVALSSASHGLWAVTQEGRQQLRADHEAAAALCLKMGLRSCKELREATKVDCEDKGLSEADLATLATLGSVLPALKQLLLGERSGSAGTDGVQRLAEGLAAGALPALVYLGINGLRMGDAGASALAAALDRSALPRLKTLALMDAAIGDAVLVALAPALRRRPALERLYLWGNPLGDEGLAALVAPPPPPAGTPPLPTGGLKKLQYLDLDGTQITDTGCAALVAALDSGALPALATLGVHFTLASAAARDAVREALAKSTAASDAAIEAVREAMARSRAA